jgi:hypothetical protein
VIDSGHVVTIVKCRDFDELPKDFKGIAGYRPKGSVLTSYYWMDNGKKIVLQMINSTTIEVFFPEFDDFHFFKWHEIYARVKDVDPELTNWIVSKMLGTK